MLVLFLFTFPDAFKFLLSMLKMNWNPFCTANENLIDWCNCNWWLHATSRDKILKKKAKRKKKRKATKKLKCESNDNSVFVFILNMFGYMSWIHNFQLIYFVNGHVYLIIMYMCGVYCVRFNAIPNWMIQETISVVLILIFSFVHWTVTKILLSSPSHRKHKLDCFCTCLILLYCHFVTAFKQ